MPDIKFPPMNPTARTNLWQLIPGLLLAVAFAFRSAAHAPEAPAVPPGKAVSIAVSRNMPVVGETVTVERLAPEAATYTKQYGLEHRHCSPLAPASSCARTATAP